MSQDFWPFFFSPDASFSDRIYTLTCCDIPGIGSFVLIISTSILSIALTIYIYKWAKSVIFG